MVLHSNILAMIGFCLISEAYMRMVLYLQHHKRWKTLWPTELYSNIHYCIIWLTMALCSDKVTIATDVGNYPKIWDQFAQCIKYTTTKSEMDCYKF